MMTSAAHLLEMKSLALLGSTGSIGVNTLDVVRRNPHLYRIHALAAGHNVDAILQQIMEFRPDVAVLATSKASIGWPPPYPIPDCRVQIGQSSLSDPPR